MVGKPCVSCTHSCTIIYLFSSIKLPRSASNLLLYFTFLFFLYFYFIFWYFAHSIDFPSMIIVFKEDKIALHRLLPIYLSISEAKKKIEIYV